VRVDGRRASIGESVDPSFQIVTVRGERVNAPAGHLTLVLHKPPNVVTTMRDERGRASVADLLPKGRRIVPVGRLDAQSTGVLLCTSDGELGGILSHPRFEVEKQYRVRVAGLLEPAQAQALAAQRIRRADGGTTFDVVLREGKNRQVRRMCVAAGLKVLDLARVRFGPVELGDLPPGKLRPLTKTERSRLEAIRRDALR
jgi:23S rRNA pseudouridine2605 synthase